MTPTFCYVPNRLLLVVLAIFGAARSFFQFYIDDELLGELSQIFVLFLNISLIFGVLSNKLSSAKRVVELCLLISVSRFLTYPIFFTSSVASALSNETFITAGLEITSNSTTAEQRFVLGVVSGFCVQFATALSVAVECLKYLLVRRLWSHAELILKKSSNFSDNSSIA